MAAIRRATATWQGDLLSGSGNVSADTSKAFGPLPVTWASRTETSEGRTSPEELVAAAHAACYSMAFSNLLAKDGSPPSQLDVTADVTFEKIEAGWRIVSSALTVRGDVPGISVDRFAELAEEAKVGCPISNALSDDIALSVEVTLAG